MPDFLPAFRSCATPARVAFAAAAVAAVLAAPASAQLLGPHAASIERGVDHGGADHLRVHCERRQRLSSALHRARPGDTVRFSGTCREVVLIAVDGLRLQGLHGAVIDGTNQKGEAVVIVDGARGVTLQSLTVQNGGDQGVLWINGSQGAMKGVIARSNKTVGLSIDGSMVDIQDVQLDQNAGGGMDAYSASRVVARGKVSASHNGGDGLAVNAMSYFELRGADVTASHNAGSGVSVINDSRLQILSFPEAQGSRIRAENNGFAGIGVLGARLGVVGSTYFGSGANVLHASGNAIGFFMPAGAILSPHATAKFVAQNNGVGMLLEDGASVLIVGGLDVKGNGTGISAIGAGTLTLVSVPPNPSVIGANTTDVELGFGTRATFGGVTPGSLKCDPSVLLRGSAACP